MTKKEMINFEMVRQLINEVLEVQHGIKTSSSVIEGKSKISTVYIYECGNIVTSTSTEEIGGKRKTEYMTYMNNDHGHPVAIYKGIQQDKRLSPLIMITYDSDKLVTTCNEAEVNPFITCNYRYCDDKLMSSAVTYLEDNKQNLCIYSYDENKRLTSMEIYNDDVEHILIDIAYIDGNVSRIFIKNKKLTDHIVSIEWAADMPKPKRITITNGMDSCVESEYKQFKGIGPKNRINFESAFVYDVELDGGEGTRKLTHTIDQFMDK